MFLLNYRSRGLQTSSVTLNQLLTNPFVKLLFPLLMLASSVWAVFWSAHLPASWYPMFVQALPAAAIGCALLLSLRFSRSRYCFLILLIAVAGLSQTAWRGQLLPATENLLFTLLMINGLAFSVLRDRNLVSVHGLLRVALLALQGFAFWALAQYTDGLPAIFLRHEWFDLPDSVAIFVQLSDGVLLLGLAICLVHACLSVLRNSSLQATFFGCQVGMLGIASGYPDPAFVPTLISGCGLMLTVAVLMDSYDMAFRDELTGLPSRRALNQLLMSLGRRYTIAMLDIDHFKKFNDTHGHDIGDEVLRMVASRIGQVGGGGKAFRYGGEEFAIVFPGRAANRAPGELEKLRASIEEYRMQMRTNNRKSGKKARKTGARQASGGKCLSVTVSIGYAERQARGKRAEAIIKAADQALYRAKRDGRNRVSE